MAEITFHSVYTLNRKHNPGLSIPPKTRNFICPKYMPQLCITQPLKDTSLFRTLIWYIQWCPD